MLKMTKLLNMGTGPTRLWHGRRHGTAAHLWAVGRAVNIFVGFGTGTARGTPGGTVARPGDTARGTVGHGTERHEPGPARHDPCQITVGKLAVYGHFPTAING